MNSISKNVLIILCIILSVILLYTSYVLYLKTLILISSKKELSLYKLIEARYNEDFDKCLFSDGNILSNIRVIDQNNHEVYIMDIIRKNTLIYRFSGISCRPCVEDDMNRLNQFKNSIIGNDLLILTDFKNPKEMRIFSKMQNLKVPIYSYPNCLNLYAEVDTFKRQPYYFLLDSCLRVHFTYISHSGQDSMHNKYFKRIIGYFKDKD